MPPWTIVNAADDFAPIVRIGDDPPKIVRRPDDRPTDQYTHVFRGE